MASLKRVEIWTDGSCLGNPGPGGWAALLIYKNRQREIGGFEPETTNNRMELRAALEGLKALKEPCRIVLRSDSRYLVEGMNSWVKNWKKRNWVRRGNRAVLNADLWRALDAAERRHQVKWLWVRGHSNNPLNDRANSLAYQMAVEGAESAPDRSR